eukprot:symbB.v1.2.008666.t1/scaffold537.1/size221706/10
MVTRPLWGSYAARRFFSIEKVDADLKELDEPARPLSYERVVSSCQSLFGATDGKNHAVVLLYKWVLSLLVPDLKELADRFGQYYVKHRAHNERGPSSWSETTLGIATRSRPPERRRVELE